MSSIAYPNIVPVCCSRSIARKIADDIVLVDLAEQIATCAHRYEINKCFPLSQRVPALARQCADWELCMQKDPSGVGRARVVAETIGEVINSFVEPISWKTLVSNRSVRILLRY